MDKIRCSCAIGNPGRILVINLCKDQDLVECIAELIRLNNFKTGIINAIGTLFSVDIEYSSTFENNSDEDSYKQVHLEGPVRLGLSQGIFFQSKEIPVIVHLHAVLIDKNQNIFCGALLAGHSPVLDSADITVQEIEGITIKPLTNDICKHKNLQVKPLGRYWSH